MYIINGELNVGRIRVKKPQNMGVKQVFNIYYLDDSGKECDFVIQTPLLTIPYSTFKNQADPNIVQFDCCNDDFMSIIESVRDTVFRKIQQKCKPLLENKIHIDRIVEKSFGKVLRCRISNVSDIVFFDQHTKPISHDELQAERQIQLILQIRWFWISTDYFGLDYNVLQVKIMTPDKKSLFHDVSKFEKYQKMLKLHIPIQAIETKMKLDGCSSSDIDDFKKTNTRPSNSELAPSIPSQTGFLSQIQKGDFKLKKTNKEDENEMKRKHIMHKISRYVDTTRTVPTVNDILDIKKRLRKV